MHAAIASASTSDRRVSEGGANKSCTDLRPVAGLPLRTEELVAGLGGHLVPLAAFALVAGLGRLPTRRPSPAGAAPAAFGALRRQNVSTSARPKNTQHLDYAHTHTHLGPRRVLPAAGVTVPAASFLVVGFAPASTVAVVDLVAFAVLAAHLGAVDVQDAVTRAALSRALAGTSHVPPASRGERETQIIEKGQMNNPKLRSQPRALLIFRVSRSHEEMSTYRRRWSR